MKTYLIKEHKLDFPILGCLYSFDGIKWFVANSASKVNVLLLNTDVHYKGITFVDENNLPVAGIPGISGYKYRIPMPYLFNYARKPELTVDCDIANEKLFPRYKYDHRISRVNQARNALKMINPRSEEEKAFIDRLLTALR